MKKLIILTMLLIIGMPLSSFANSNPDAKYYGTTLCSNPKYYCIKIKPGMSWKRLFPDPVQQEIVQKINRTDMPLWSGKTIAVPHNLDKLTVFDVSPFPKHIDAPGRTLIIVDQERLAWGAYDAQGQLQKWGPISSGKDYCPDVKRACTTVTGIFYVFNKQDKKCESNIYPVGEGGAKMPYCMFFFRGFALHGSAEVVGYRDSHGCVRLFTQDAKWLNENFVQIPNKKNNYQGTKVVIQKLTHLKDVKNERNKK